MERDRQTEAIVLPSVLTQLVSSKCCYFTLFLEWKGFGLNFKHLLQLSLKFVFGRPSTIWNNWKNPVKQKLKAVILVVMIQLSCMFLYTVAVYSGATALRNSLSYSDIDHWLSYSTCIQTGGIYNVVVLLNC